MEKRCVLVSTSGQFCKVWSDADISSGRAHINLSPRQDGPSRMRGSGCAVEAARRLQGGRSRSGVGALALSRVRRISRALDARRARGRNCLE
jgi:hypothetical protein